MTSTIGIPIKLLNEAQVRLPCSHPPLSAQIAKQKLVKKRRNLTSSILQGHVITLEITSGQVYRGKLLEGTIPQPFSYTQRKMLMYGPQLKIT